MHFYCPCFFFTAMQLIILMSYCIAFKADKRRHFSLRKDTDQWHQASFECSRFQALSTALAAKASNLAGAGIRA